VCAVACREERTGGCFPCLSISEYDKTNHVGHSEIVRRFGATLRHPEPPETSVGQGWTCPPHFCLAEIAPEIYMPVRRVFFYGRVCPWTQLRPQISIMGSHSALAMCVHPAFFDLATPL